MPKGVPTSWLIRSRSTTCWIASDSEGGNMSDFSGMEDLLQDFLQEAHDLLSDVDNKLVDLEKMPDDRSLLNDIFRGFHTVTGGAGFLNATEFVTLCHLTENLFDRLRNGELELTSELMDVIMAATKGVREMFGELGQLVQPQPADPEVIAALQGALTGEVHAAAPAVEAAAGGIAVTPAAAVPAQGANQATPASPYGRRATDRPGGQAVNARRAEERVRENTIRVDTSRLDQVLNLY